MDEVRRLGIALQSDKSLATYAELGAQVERYGFDTVSVYSDLMFQPALPALLSIAAATKHIQLGPACLNPFMMHPVEIAGQTAVLDAASKGRSYLGLARGAWLDSLGVAAPRPVRAIRETIGIVKHLLNRQSHAFRGELYSLSHNHQLQYPVQRSDVPILIGTWSPQLAGLAGELAAEVKIGGSSNPDMVSVMRQWISKGAQRVSRTPDEIEIVLGAVSVVDENRERAREAARRQVALYLPVVLPLDSTYVVDPELLTRISNAARRNDMLAVGQLVSDEMLDRFAFAGTPSDIINQVENVFDAGATRIEFGTPHGLDAREGIRLLGTRVLPHFALSS